MSLDELLPPCRFDEHRPAKFALTHLLRLLTQEAKAHHFKKGDGRDLCHAVLAAACGSLITLDKSWKRRVEGLPQPHRLARIYYRPELDELVATLSSADERARRSYKVL